MEKIKREGKAKSIGVSNFREKDLTEVLKIATIPPAVNQIEYHPYLQQDGIGSFCAPLNIVVEAYSPLTPLVRCPGTFIIIIINHFFLLFLVHSFIHYVSFSFIPCILLIRKFVFFVFVSDEF